MTKVLLGKLLGLLLRALGLLFLFDLLALQFEGGRAHDAVLSHLDEVYGPQSPLSRWLGCQQNRYVMAS